MLKNDSLLCRTIFILMLVLSLCGNAFALGEVKKAKKLMASEMYPQAIALLEKRIAEKQNDAEAHFQLGVCYIMLHNYSKADEWFTSTMSHDATYGPKIGDEYRRAGEMALHEDQMKAALALFKKAIHYHPNLKEGIIEACFLKGESAFEMIIDLDPNQKSIVAEKYDLLSAEAENEEMKMANLKKAAEKDPERYGEEYKARSKELGQKYLDLAYENAGWLDRQKAAADYERLARKYLGDSPVDERFAIQIHDHNLDGSKNRVTFNIEAGKITPVWHELAKDIIWMTFVKEFNFHIYLLDGTVVPVEKDSDFPELAGKGFKIAAPHNLAVVAFDIYPYSVEKMEELKKKSE
jgi:tetratricopeptide (TPR) repeat protein